METKPQVDSPQKSPVSKTLPPSENKDEAAKQPLQNVEAPCASTSTPTSGNTASSSSQPNADQDSKAESKPEALPSSTETKHHATEGPNTETSLQHPIISVDIKKTAPSGTKNEVPQESKTNIAEVPPEVLASVVTTAVVNEAASTIGDADDGLAISGSKVTSDPSKVDSVVEQELNKLSEKIKEEIQFKSKDGVQSDAKPLPNGDIDLSPVKGVAETEKVLEEVAIKESESIAQSMVEEEELSKHRNGSKTEACKSTEAVAQIKDNILDQIQKSEITSTNGVPGIITVVGISKKDSTQSKEAGESTTNSKSDDASETIKGTDDATKEEHSKDEGFEKIGSSYKYDDKRELASVSSSGVDCKEKTKVGENVLGDNLTDSAKIQSSIQRVCGDIDSSQNKEIADAENPIQNEDSQFKKCESSKTKSTSENEGEKSASQRDIDKDEDTQEKSAEDAKENTEGFDKSGNESILDKTTTQELITSAEPEEPKEKNNKSETDSSKKELAPEDNIVSDASKQTEPCAISKSGVPSATSDSSTNIVAPKVEESPEELCDMSMMASMTTSQILTEEMLNGSSMEQDKNKKNLSLDSEASSKEDQHKIEVCSMASATSGTCDIGVGSDERAMIRCASGDGGEEEVDGGQATTEIELTEEASADRQSSKSPSASDAAEISQEKRGEAEDKPASAASRSSSIPEATVYEPPERRRSAASSAANEDKRDGDAGDKSKDESEKEEDGDKGTLTDSQETTGKDTLVDNNKGESDAVVSTEGKADERQVLDDHVETTVDQLLNEEKHEEKENSETAEIKEKGTEENDEKATERPDSKAEQEKTDAEDATSSQSASGEKDEIKEGADKSAEKDVADDAGDTKDADSAVETPGTVGKEDEEQTEEKNVEKSDSEKVEGEKVASEVEVDGGEKEAKEDEVPKELEEPKTLVEEEKEVQEEASEIKDENDANDSSEKNEGAKNEEEKAEIGGEKEEEKTEIETDRDADAVKDGGDEQPKHEEPPETEEEQSAKEAENAEAAPEEKADEEAAATQEADNEAQKEAGDKELAGEDEAPAGKQPKGEEEGTEEPQSPTKRGRSPDKAGRRGVSPISSPPKSLKTPPSPQKPQKATSPKKKNGALSPIKTPKTPASDTRKLPPIKAPVGLAPNPNLKNIRSKIGSFDNIKYKPGGGDKKVISTKKLEWKAAPKIGSLDHSFKGEKKRSRSKDGKDGKGADGQSGDEAEPDVTSAETFIKPEGAADLPVAIAAES